MTDSIKLISAYFDNHLTPEQAVEFRSRLLKDDDFLYLFARYSLIHSCIRDELVEADLQESLDRFALYASDDTSKNLSLSDTDQVALECVMQPEESQESRINRIKTQAESQLQAFLTEQEALRRIRSSVKKSSPGIREVFRAGLRRLNVVWTISVRTTTGVAICGLLILMILGGIQYILSHRVMATLGETVQAQWTDAPKGVDLRSQWMTLEQGYAQIIFRNGAHVIIQAPCHFRPVSPKKMFLSTGTVSSRVSKGAVGFVIETPTSQIVDLGTEFGVVVDSASESELHVFEGEVEISSSVQRGTSSHHRIKKGQTAFASLLGDININEARYGIEQFTRRLPDPNRLGLPGKRLDLADTVGGGNGFGTGMIGGDTVGARGTINPITGRVNDPTRPLVTQDTSKRFDFQHYDCSNEFIPVPALAYVDGVFVPDGGQGQQIISSSGLIFDECPDTDGQVKWNITNGWRYRDMVGDKRTTDLLSRANGISMHANSGITFDLDAINQAMPGVKAVAFSSLVGVPVTYSPEITEVDIWILVDGEVRFVERDVSFKHIVDVRVELSSTDRFLTLVVTDSQTLGQATFPSNMDWCFWEDPALELISAPLSTVSK